MKLSPQILPRDRQQLERADAQNHKKDRDIYVSPGRLILADTVTGDLYSVEVTSGVLGITAL